MKQPMFIQNPIKQLPSVKELWQQLKEKAEQKTLDKEHFEELQTPEQAACAISHVKSRHLFYL